VQPSRPNRERRAAEPRAPRRRPTLPRTEPRFALEPPGSSLYNRRVDRRAAAFARLFEGVRSGVHRGPRPVPPSTIAANPHLKLVFELSNEVPEPDPPARW
jgi:hypothetical protein